MTPRWSVVIPTRRRAWAVGHAVTTSLRQTQGDLEVVVCDNHSGDGTDEAVAAVADGRVRYVETGRVLPQPDNWDRAIGEASGEWIVVLTDDDGLTSGLLATLDEHLEGSGQLAAVWGAATYFHPGSDGPENLLLDEPRTWRIQVVESRPELERLFTRSMGPWWPRLGANCAVHRSVIDTVRSRTGRVFHPPGADSSFAALLLALEQHYLVVDRPLSVMGVSPTSIGRGALRGTAAVDQFRSELGGDRLMRHVPLDAALLTNFMADSLLEAKRVAPDLLADVELDWVRWFVTTRRDIRQLEAHGAAGTLAREWSGLLARQPAPVRAAVRRQLASDRARALVRDTARRAVSAVPALAEVRDRRHARAGRTPFLQMHGDDAGFSDMTGAAAWLSDHVARHPTGDGPTGS